MNDDQAPGLTIVQITDPHLTPAGARPVLNQMISPEQKLATVFTDIKGRGRPLDLVVITGDLIHEGGPKDYTRLRRWLAEQERELGVPIRVLVGNHDRTAAFYTGYLAQRARPRFYFRQILRGVALYFLDTKCGNFEPGYLDADQLAWLDAGLSKTPDQSALIFMHHPLASVTMPQMRYSGLQNGADLVAVCAGRPVRGIFAGHVHFPTTYWRQGLFNAVADSAAYHIDCSNPWNHYVNDASGYSVITLSPAGQVGVVNRHLLWSSTINAVIKVPEPAALPPAALAALLEQAGLAHNKDWAAGAKSAIFSAKTNELQGEPPR